MVTDTQTTRRDNEIGGMEKVELSSLDPLQTKRSKAVFEKAVKERHIKGQPAKSGRQKTKVSKQNKNGEIEPEQEEQVL